jgi:hypothetical protein
MMRLGRRASLLVAFSLLVSTATVYAECAWVLCAHALPAVQQDAAAKLGVLLHGNG